MMERKKFLLLVLTLICHICPIYFSSLSTEKDLRHTHTLTLVLLLKLHQEDRLKPVEEQCCLSSF